MNEIFRNLTIENLLNLKASFTNSKKIFWSKENNRLFHPGEYGSYREELLKKWLRMYVPRKFDISSGFVINAEGKVSTQCDIVIYDRSVTPHIETIDDQNFFPVEAVVAVGEVKSEISSCAELNKYLLKLSELKKLRQSNFTQRVYSSMFKDKFDISKNSYHNIFTFLICHKFNFNFSLKDLNYDNIEAKFKQNLILSLEDGIINYQDRNTPNVAYPFNGEHVLQHHFRRSDDSELSNHIILFLTALNTAMFFTTILEIDITHYLTNSYFDEIT